MTDGFPVSMAGRVVSCRKMGGIAFGYILDGAGKIQFCLNKKLLGPELFKTYTNQLTIGCYIGVTGAMWTSDSTKERTIQVDAFKLFTKPLASFPDKWNGIEDTETRARKRYLDCITNHNTFNLFRFRSNLIGKIRVFLDGEGYLEVETPMLTPQPSGALARPFQTYHKALDTNVYLRIAPETYLKRAIACGYDRVYEIGKNFRNEGIDHSHLQEFTSLEWYTAFADYMDNLEFFKRLLKVIAGDKIDVTNIPVVNYMDLIGPHITPDTNPRDYDRIFKEKVRDTLVAPVFVKDYPAHMVPLGARKQDNPDIAEMWQFIMNGWEIVKCYTELVDPVLQRKLLEEQAEQRKNGDEEAMPLEESFLECMEYGMPPMSGLGIGIDRLVAVLNSEDNLKNVVLFPLMLEKK
jgi:lysyl-tRNA synthetase class 2